MAKDEKDSGENEDGESGKGGKLKIILIALAGLILVGGSVGATLFIVGGGEDEAAPVAAVEESPRAIYYAINPEFRSSYVVNGRQRLFQVGLNLVTRDSSAVSAFSTHAPAIRNKVVMLLSGQSFESLQQLEGREALRQSLIEGIQEILQSEVGKPIIETVLFTQFVMQ